MYSEMRVKKDFKPKISERKKAEITTRSMESPPLSKFSKVKLKQFL